MLNGYKILTVTHRQTPLQSIGRFVVPFTDEAGLKAKLDALKNRFQVDEMMYLATCNRILFAIYTEKPLPVDFKQQFFQSIFPEISSEAIEENVALMEGPAAADHLFKVAASIDSMVVGEREILRQLREAYDRCMGWGLTGDHLRLLVQAAVVAAKEVYAQTRLGEKSISIVSLAIKELLKTKLPKTARILMIGAGQTNMLVAKFLAKYGYHQVAVFNRTLENAAKVAAITGGRAYFFDQLESFTEGFDCLIICTGATQAIVDKQLYAKLLAGETDRKTVIDLSVPNNVCEQVTGHFDIRFIEIENLKTLASENLAFREQEVTAANELLESHLVSFKTAVQRRRIERALHQIPQEVRAVRERAMNEVFKKEMEILDEPARLLLERMMTYMERKCTGIPMKVAKSALALPA